MDKIPEFPIGYFTRKRKHLFGIRYQVSECPKCMSALRVPFECSIAQVPTVWLSDLVRLKFLTAFWMSLNVLCAPECPSRYNSRMYLEFTNMALASWKDHLISYLICLCTFFGLNDHVCALVWFSAEKVHIFFSWIRVISFGEFRPISQGWDHLRIHPVGILTIDFDNLIRNKNSKYI